MTVPTILWKQAALNGARVIGAMRHQLPPCRTPPFDLPRSAHRPLPKCVTFPSKIASSESCSLVLESPLPLFDGTPNEIKLRKTRLLGDWCLPRQLNFFFPFHGTDFLPEVESTAARLHRPSAFFLRLPGVLGALASTCVVDIFVFFFFPLGGLLFSVASQLFNGLAALPVPVCVPCELRV